MFGGWAVQQPQHLTGEIMIPKVPAAILPLIQNPPLLKGESQQEYYELFGALVSETAPVDTVEWLWLIQFTDCSWEIIRNRRLRARIRTMSDRRIESNRRNAERSTGPPYNRGQAARKPQRLQTQLVASHQSYTRHIGQD